MLLYGTMEDLKDSDMSASYSPSSFLVWFLFWISDIHYWLQKPKVFITEVNTSLSLQIFYHKLFMSGPQRWIPSPWYLVATNVYKNNVN
jgi:hypothetical protein